MSNFGLYLGQFEYYKAKFPVYILYLSRWSTFLVSKYTFWLTIVGCLSNVNLFHKFPAVNWSPALVCYSGNRTPPQSPQHWLGRRGTTLHHDRAMIELRVPSTCICTFSFVQSTTHRLHQMAAPLPGLGWISEFFCPRSLCRRSTTSPLQKESDARGLPTSSVGNRVLPHYCRVRVEDQVLSWVLLL